MRRLPALLPAHALNGMAVAFGVALAYGFIAAMFGAASAKLALAGAVCASLADQPSTVRRNLQRVGLAAVLAVAASLVAAGLRPWPLGLGLGIAAVALVATLTLAWGPRAGPVSFAAVLALVFTMAVPEGTPVLAVAGWHAAGALAFAACSALATALLQRRYRTLALAAALQALARLLRSRAALLEGGLLPDEDQGRMRTMVGDEALLAERLQAARDLLFAAPGAPAAGLQIAMLLRAVELRDTLLASRLDLDLVGEDEAGRFLRERLAGGLRQVALALDEAEAALLAGSQPAAGALELREVFEDVPLPPGDARLRLKPLLANRLQRLADDAMHLHALLRGLHEALPLQAPELQRFVATEGWAFSAVRAQLHLRSPVLRHALRAALALGAAYALGRWLPWASHPHWLVLSVAVVLRGTLEQTLVRRNARVVGTLIGCGLVLALSRAPALQPLAFVVAVGTAHAFINVRYLVTAAAATVMALLQAYWLEPEHGFAIAERVADTFIGAALAWAFSYVLPSWERRSLPGAVERALQALRDYAQQALQPGAAAGVAQRLARLQAYEALGSLAAALQRSLPEPERVRLPLAELAQLLDHAHRLMAHLSVVRMMLVQRAQGLQSPAAAEALRAAEAVLREQLHADAAAPAQPPASAPDLQALPGEPPAENPLPWLQRRLQVSALDAYRVGTAARALLARLQA
ncbi:MAG: FUSC family membrane protein [Pseudomonadota bacterium]